MLARTVLVAAFALALASCAGRMSADGIDPAFEAPYTLDAGDRLRVVVFGQDGLTNSYAVDSAGKITMPLIGAVTSPETSMSQVDVPMILTSDPGRIPAPTAPMCASKAPAATAVPSFRPSLCAHSGHSPPTLVSEVQVSV